MTPARSRLSADEKAKAARKLYADGRTWREIANAVGYPDADAARTAAESLGPVRRPIVSALFGPTEFDPNDPESVRDRIARITGMAL